MEAYLTAKEAAEYLKLAERTLVRLAHEGKIPGVKIGGQWRFRRALLDEYLDTLAAESVGSSGAAPNQVIDAPFDEILTVDQIIPDLKAKDRSDVIHSMATHVTDLGLVQDQAWLEAALTARERIVPTAVPEGIISIARAKVRSRLSAFSDPSFSPVSRARRIMPRAASAFPDGIEPSSGRLVRAIRWS